MIKRLKLMFSIFAVAVVVMAGCASNKTPQQPTTQQPPTVTKQTTPQQPSVVTQQPTGQTQVSAGNAANGKKLFDTNCSGCHSTDTTAKIGPGLKGFYSKNKLPNGNPVNDANLAQWMKKGNDKMPGNAALSSQDTTDINAYLKTL